MPEFLRVALLGGGKMALQHAAAIRHCRNARLVAVADPLVPAAELTARFGKDVAPYTDPHELLAAVKPDVVHIITPPDTHAALARACLEAGAHVYVEKPFALTTADATSVLRLAESKGLGVCAAHQILFQDSGRSYRRHLPMIGEIVHVESFFSFRPVRRRAGGGGLSTPVDQLIDILPHPVYLLLDALRADGGARAEITALDVSVDGEVRAVIRRGRAFGSLVVSLNARPVESWLRVMGTNGMVEADFVLGNVIRHPGPGASAPAVVLKPFSRAWQIGWGSSKALLKLLFRRQKSYPGLAELLELFYTSIQERTTPPIDTAEIMDTVRICEAISARLREELRIADDRAAAKLREQEASLPSLNGRGVVLLTGGTGMLGQPTAALLRERGWHVRVPVRRALSQREKLPGIEYVATDLADAVSDDLMKNVEYVVHLAAETAGTKADHERNTVRATQQLIRVMKRCGISNLVSIGSLAIIRPARFGRPLNEHSEIKYGDESRGPYVWAKSVAERDCLQAQLRGDLKLWILRLGPLVNFQEFQAPGRLGREVARLFVAMGRPTNVLAVCDVAFAAKAIANAVEDSTTFPDVVNVIQSPAVTRKDLVRRLRAVRPDLRVLWLPFWIVWLLNVASRIVQKLLRPRSPALDIYSAFKSERYDDSTIRRLNLVESSRSQ